MDATTITAIVGVPIALVGVSVGYFALDESRRLELYRFWRRWLKIAFVVSIVVNSVVGLYLFFFTGSAQVTKVGILSLLLHLFNLFSLVVYAFLIALLRSLDERNSKREALTASVEALRAKVERLKSSA